MASREDTAGSHKSPTMSGVSWRALVEACRPYQWIKNVLVFVAPLAAHDLDPMHARQALFAFLCFCAVASSGYLLNDIKDVEADRRHARKRNRAFAARRATPAAGMTLAAVLLAAGMVGAALADLEFLGVLAAYFVVTNAYTLYFKRFPLIDAIILAGLYTLRIISGAAATDTPLTMWLLGFSMFLFTSLAFAKRYVELADLEQRNEAAVAGRGYRAGDTQVLMALGVSSGIAAVLTLALYVSNTASAEMYDRPEMLWGVCPLLLYWIGRMWLAAQRRVLNDDPIVFAFRDRVSLVVFACALVPIALAL